MNRDTDSVPGVYAIRNTVTGDTYVGASRNLYARVSDHLGQIRRGVHPVPRVNELAREHGSASFEGVILERCAVDAINDREWRWTRELKPTLSRLPAADAPGEWDRKATQVGRKPWAPRGFIEDPSKPGLSPSKMKARRTALRLTQAEVAGMIGMATAGYSRIECGINSNPTIGVLSRIAQALGCMVHDLMNHGD